MVSSGRVWMHFRSNRRRKRWTRHHVGKQWTLCDEEEEEARPENVGLNTTPPLQKNATGQKAKQKPPFGGVGTDPCSIPVISVITTMGPIPFCWGADLIPQNVEKVQGQVYLQKMSRKSAITRDLHPF